MRLSANDPSSYSTPENEKIKHINFDWTINFEKKNISGSVELQFELFKDVESILLDIDELVISQISINTEAGPIPVSFNIDGHVAEIGSRLTIYLPTKTCGRLDIVINYETSPAAGGLQWLNPRQTSGKKHPFLFSQFQPIYARSVFPCQDTPSVKFTYAAKLRYDSNLVALMSGINIKCESGYSEFEQTVPIQSYLMAIAVGDLHSKDLSPISRVWAEKDVVEQAAWEFAETPDFLEKAIALCGEYVWKRYDVLVMPPSFPYGGMENPCLTFVTPTIIAGDRSLVSVVAHEIAHSWTGNLVTNRNFEHFWLNEGFTVFTEEKILGRIFGPLYRDFHFIRGISELKDCIETQLKNTPDVQRLVVDLSNLSPDDAFSTVPYMKGCTFLRYLEDLFGGPEIFEPFFRSYLEKYKFQSIFTDDFKKTVWEYFDDAKYEEPLSQIDWDTWLYGTGMPPHLPKLDYSIANQANKHADLWKTNDLEAIKQSATIKETLSSQQIIEMLSKIIDAKAALKPDVVELLAKTYNIEGTKNAEIQFYYLRLCIWARLESKVPAIFAFADSNFRMKFVRPIYKELADWPEMKAKTIDHFNGIKDEMMKMVSVLISKDLGIYQG